MEILLVNNLSRSHLNCLIGKVADNITELAFEIRGYAASIENLLENNKKLHLAWKQQEERNLELVHTIQVTKMRAIR